MKTITRLVALAAFVTVLSFLSGCEKQAQETTATDYSPPPEWTSSKELDAEAHEVRSSESAKPLVVKKPEHNGSMLIPLVILHNAQKKRANKR